MGEAKGPSVYGDGTWPHMSFGGVVDPGMRLACELTQRLALLILERVGPAEGPAPYGYSRRRLAEDSGVSAATITNVLAGRYFPQLHVMTKLLSALNLPLEAVLPVRPVRRRGPGRSSAVGTPDSA